MAKRRSQRQQAPPEFLIDRSLGRYALAEAVRARGIKAHTLFDLYDDLEERLDDTVWLKDAGENGWPVLTKDPSIQRRAHELAEVERCRVLMFALPRADMTGAEQVDRYMKHWNRIVQACKKSGPRIYSVQAERLVLTYPPPATR